MGKYPNSDLHDKYSNWHWNLTKKHSKYKCLETTDIDKSYWIEYVWHPKYEYMAEPTMVIDLKWMHKNDSITVGERGVYNWFLSMNIPVYIIRINQEFTEFKVVNYNTKESQYMEELEFANFLLQKRIEKQEQLEKQLRIEEEKLLHKGMKKKWKELEKQKKENQKLPRYE